MRLTLVIGSLMAGGAERVMSTLANGWVEQGNAVTLITIADAATDFYKLEPAVSRVGLNLMQPARNAVDSVRMNLRRVRALRSAIRTSTPDVVISFVDATNVLTLLATFGIAVPVAVSERIDPRRHPIGQMWKSLRRITYRQAAAVVVQSGELRTWAEGVAASPKHVFVIPNPVPVPSSAPAEATGRGPTIVGMGRLHSQKGFDLLVEAFSRVAAKFPEWRMIIYGEGPERAQLERQAAARNLTDRVSFPGIIPDAGLALQAAEIFVLSSRYEGMPNALLEAMACRIAVISTDCPTGPADFIRDGINGMLVAVEDVAALAEALLALMSDPGKRLRLASEAEHIRERFSLSKVLGMWHDVFEKIGVRDYREATGSGVK